MFKRPVKIETKSLNFYFGNKHILKDINIRIEENSITSILGASGSGKSTLLRAFNRMHDLYVGNSCTGEILLYPDNCNILDDYMDPIKIRSRIGMIFQKPNPFPSSIYENIAYGLVIRGIKDKDYIRSKVKESLESAALWDDVKDRLNEHAWRLSGGQQQRLCIARTLAVDSEIILFDEPTSALDPKATSNIEELMIKLKERLTIILVTHNMAQAARISDHAAYMKLGKVIGFNKSNEFFNNYKDVTIYGNCYD